MNLPSTRPLRPEAKIIQKSSSRPEHTGIKLSKPSTLAGSDNEHAP